MFFTFNEKPSYTFGLSIKSSNHLSRSAKSIESIKVPGRTGNLIIDDGSFENKTIEIVCFLDRRDADQKIFANTIKNIGAWLQDVTGYKVLKFSDGSTFNAICINQIDVTETIKNFGELSIRFEVYEA